MKKLLFMAAVAVFGFTTINAQEKTTTGVLQKEMFLQLDL